MSAAAIVAIAVAACTPSAPTSSTGPSPTHLSLAQVSNIVVPLAGGTSVRLRNGTARVSYGGASADVYSLAGFYSEGDLNGDGRADAALDLVDDSAGSGTFHSLLVVLNTRRGLKVLPLADLGDRVVVQKIAITAGLIQVSYLDRSDTTAMTDVDRSVTDAYRVRRGQVRRTQHVVRVLTQLPRHLPDAKPQPLGDLGKGRAASGRLGYGQTQTFDFRAHRGQALDVSLDAPLGLFVTVQDAKGHLSSTASPTTDWSGTLPRGGEWTVTVASLNGADSAFDLTLKPLAIAPATSGALSPFTPPPTPVRATGKVAYLTFDDGPSGTYTPQILAVLARYGAHATFFDLGSQVQQFPNLLRDEVAAGNTIGNHTWDHQSLAGMSKAQFDSEVSRTKRILGTHGTDCLRPPYGATDGFTAQYAAQLGYRLQLWDIDPRDWSRPGVQGIVDNVMTNLAPGRVILMHDGGGDRSETVAALDRILRALTAQGWTFPTLC